MTYTYIDRDISWLAFNDRVLQEAKDKSLPLFERIKFLAIYSSNLDEFFRVRVAHHQNIVKSSKKTRKKLAYDSKDTLKEIKKIVNHQLEDFSKIFESEILSELKKQNIFILRRTDLNKEQKDFIENFFQTYLLPYCQPVLLIKDKIRPFLVNGSIYLAVRLRVKGKNTHEEEFGIIKIPSEHVARFVKLPNAIEGRNDIIILDDIVRHFAAWLFPGYEILDAYSIKLTRDAELYIDDEYSGNLVSKVKNSLEKRNVGPPSRFVYDRYMPERMLYFFVEMFDLDKGDLLPEGRYHNNSDFFKFPDFGLDHLKYPPMPPVHREVLEKSKDIFKIIKEKDQLLTYPYESYKSVVRFFQQAARDEQVTHIKIVQYRVAKKSKIMEALMEAAQSGKKVTAFIEVKARFDEEANLNWGETLAAAGVEVHYSIPGIKVHSKIALVERKEGRSTKQYCYLSTGNFHEDTAKIYSDFGIFTANPKMTKEVAKVFEILETKKIEGFDFQQLLVGKFNLRSGLIAKIDREIALANEGKNASIFLKMNSIEDKEMIDKLYEASNAGVKIQMIVRGICCLSAGEKKQSQNIKVISIVDRFLEHARVFIFGNDGKEEMYLSSADFMNRNLSHRIEVSFPVLDADIKEKIRNYCSLQWKDNVKARIIDEKLQNKHVEGNKDIAIRSQFETYYEIKNEEGK
jgi:polyphosphate kinase